MTIIKNKYTFFIIIMIILTIISSCSFKKKSIGDQFVLQKSDTLTVLEQNKKQSIEVGDCGKIYLSDFKHLTIEEVYFSAGTFGLINCLVNFAEKGDTLAQNILFEICNVVGDNVSKFDLLNSSDINMFLKQTLYLTPKSNKWIPVLLKYAKDDNCEQSNYDHYPSEEHFGKGVTGDIITNLSNKEYAKELAYYQSSIFADEIIRSTEKANSCYWKKKKHKIFMERLENDYRDGKLNFE